MPNSPTKTAALAQTDMRGSKHVLEGQVQGPHSALAYSVDGALRAPLVILCHGMFSSRNGHKHLRLAQLLNARNINALRFDFTGAGNSGGDRFELTYTRQYEDCLAVIDWVCAQGIDSVGLFGSSMGGTTAILSAAREERIEALATLAAVAHPELIAERYPGWVQAIESLGYVEAEGVRVGPEILHDSLQHNVVAAMGVILCPSLIVHGERDDLVPSSDGHDLACAARSTELMIVAEGDHRLSNPTRCDQALSRIADFFAQRLTRPHDPSEAES